MKNLHALTRLPALTLLFALTTALAVGPLRAVDDLTHGHWAKQLTPGLYPFLDQVSDALAGQAVCVPVLLAVAAAAAWRHRSWWPLMIAAAAEAAFYGGIGTIKVLLGRTAPSTGDSAFFNGGVLEHAWHGMAYPSGHASEAVLIYGTAAYLAHRYWDLSPRARRWITGAVVAVALHAVVVSFYLGFHWLTDLLGGLVGGALMLRLLIDGERRAFDWVTDRELAAMVTRARIDDPALAGDGALRR